MPPPVCNRCRCTPAAEGDSWCAACTCWKALGRELGASWDSPGARVLAADLVVNTCRQVRALRSLSAGLARQETSGGGAGRASAHSSDRAPREADTRSSLPRRREERQEVAKEEQESGEEEEEETDEEEERRRSKRRSRTPVRRSTGGNRRPPEPEGPPPPPGTTSLGVTLGRGEAHRRDHRKTESTRHDRDRDRRREGHSRKKKNTRRAGRKHQRLHRLATTPHLRVHRKASDSFLELSSLQPGSQDLGRLGR